MADQIKKIIVEYEERTEALDRITAKLKAMAGEAGISEEALEGINASLEDQVEASKKVEQQQRKMKSALSSLYKEYARLEIASRGATDEKELRNYQSQLDKTRSKIGRLTSDLKKLDKEGTKAASNLSKGFGRFGSGLQDILKFAAGNLLAGGIQGIVTSVASTLGTQIRSGIGDAIDFEQTNIAFETFLGNAEDAKKLIADLIEFSNVTPFQTDSVVNAGKQLLAFGIEADKVVDSLKALGDIAAGTGADIGDLAFKYGQIRTQQTAFTEDLNELAGRGIPIFEALAKQFGIAESEVKKFAATGKIGFEDIEQAFNDMTAEGGKFFDLTAKQSESLGGKISTLQGKYATLRREVVEELVPAITDLVDFLTETIDGTNELGEEIKLTNEAYSELVLLINELLDGLRYLDDNFNIVRNTLSRVSEELGIITQKADGSTNALGKLLSVIRNPITGTQTLLRDLLVSSSEARKAREEAEETVNLLEAENLARPEPVPPVDQEFILSAEKGKKVVKELTKAKVELLKVAGPTGDAFQIAAEQIDAAFTIEQIDAVNRFGESLAKAFNQENLEILSEQFQDEALERQIRYLEELKDLYEQYGQDVTDIDQLIQENRKQLLNELVNISLDSFGQISDFIISQNELQADARVASLERQRDAELKAAGDNADERLRIEEEYRAQIDKVQRDAARKNQEISLIQTVIAQAVAVAEAFKQLGPIAGAIASIGVAATIAKQISIIKSQKFATGGFNIEGPGTGVSDSIPAMISRGETVVTAADTLRYWDLMKGIVEDKRPLHKIPLPGGGMGYTFDDRFSPANTRLKTRAHNSHSINYNKLGKAVAEAITNEQYKPGSPFFTLLRHVQDNLNKG